jgi:hypothetical protein
LYFSSLSLSFIFFLLDLELKKAFNFRSTIMPLGELMDLAGEDFRLLPLGYGSSAGRKTLRAEIARMCQVDADSVVITNGTALGLFLLAFEVCFILRQDRPLFMIFWLHRYTRVENVNRA